METSLPTFIAMHKSLIQVWYCVLTALVASSGFEVSFKTTGGGVVLLKDISAKGNSRSFILFRRKHWLLTIRKL
jgi:transcriptional regulator CtsR